MNEFATYIGLSGIARGPRIYLLGALFIVLLPTAVFYSAPSPGGKPGRPEPTGQPGSDKKPDAEKQPGDPEKKPKKRLFFWKITMRRRMLPLQLRSLISIQ